MGRPVEKTCDVCCKRMRVDHLKIHMKQHEKKTNSIDEVTEYNWTVDDVALKNKIMIGANEYRRKLELGREITNIVIKNNIPTASLDKDKIEALEIFEKHGQVKEIKAVEWRQWQKELLQYVNNPTQRTIIWVVGEKGNEGKSFFQDKIEEQQAKPGLRSAIIRL